MKQEEFELFKCIAGMSQENLRKSLANILKKHYSNVITTKEYIIAQGEIPIALVAHLDTVFAYGKRKIYYDRDGKAIKTEEYKQHMLSSSNILRNIYRQEGSQFYNIQRKDIKILSRKITN